MRSLLWTWCRSTEVRTSAVESAVLPFPKAVFSYWCCCLPQLVVFGKVELKSLSHFCMGVKKDSSSILLENLYNYCNCMSVKTPVSWSTILEGCGRRNSFPFFSKGKVCRVARHSVCLLLSLLNSGSGSPLCAGGDFLAQACSLASSLCTSTCCF